jgi:hypothetical protein
MSGFRNIAVAEELCRAAEQKYSHRFATMDECVTCLLQELLRDDAVRMDEKEARIIEERLKGLGYV